MFLIKKRNFTPAVQIFSNYVDWDIYLGKIIYVFELGALCLIRAASEKMFLIRTNSWKCIEKQNLVSN